MDVEEAAPAEVAEKPKRTRRAKAQAAPAEAEVTATTPEPTVTEPAPARSDAGDPAASQSPDAANEDTAELAEGGSDDKPRRGWWQRTFGA